MKLRKLILAGPLALVAAAPAVASDYTMPISCQGPPFPDSDIEYVIDSGGLAATCSDGDGSPLTATGSALHGTVSAFTITPPSFIQSFSTLSADYTPPASPTAGTDVATLMVSQGSHTFTFTQEIAYNREAGSFGPQLDGGISALRPVQKRTKLAFRAPAGAFPGDSTIYIGLRRFGKKVGSARIVTVGSRSVSIPVKLRAGVRKLLKTQGVNAQVSMAASNPFNRASHTRAFQLKLKELKHRKR